MGKCSGSKAFKGPHVRSPWPRNVVVVALALGGVAAAREGFAGSPESALSYREVLEHIVVVPVLLNGQGPFDLVLDTAAAFTTLEPSLAAELGLEPGGRVPVVTIAGARTATRARLDQVKLGPVGVSGVDVLCSEVAILKAADRRIRGILGQSALARVSFGLDHSRRLVLFEPPSRPDAVLTLDDQEGRPAVRFAAKQSSAVLSLVLDSGLLTPVLFEKPGTRLPVERVSGHFQAETNSGTARLAMGNIEGRVGGLSLPRALVAVLDDAAAGGRLEDGLLPTRSFRVVYFDRGLRQVLLRGRR